VLLTKAVALLPGGIVDRQPRRTTVCALKFLGINQKIGGRLTAHYWE
jgi:hypothetical protein